MSSSKNPLFGALTALSLATFLTACSSEAEKAQDPAMMEKPVDRTALPAPTGHAKPSVVEQKSDVLEFRYAYPAEAVAIPALAAEFDKDRNKMLLNVNEEAEDQAADAKANDFPVRTHIYTQNWEKVTQTPRFLSLSSNISTYTGGAHGMENFDGLVWDMEKNKSLKAMDFFTSPMAFDAAVSQSFCDAIAAEKKAKGIEPIADPDGVFEACPKASEQVVWIGSSDGRKFDRLTIAITAYVVGPYSEGSYQIDVPMNAALVRAVKPEYSEFFRAKR